jgi:catecholate siderophore receptor
MTNRARWRLPARLPIPALLALMAGGAAAQPTVPEPKPADTTPVLPAVRAKAAAEPTGKDTLRATTTSIGKGKQELRDIPQSVTVVTEKLIDDRNVDTLKDALKQTAGVAFQAAEGGEEDIRLRGFSLQASGDIFIDGMRDPAFYERDTFNWDRLELLRGSASMLFGRGSTGGAVNQVSKQPFAMTQHEVSVTLGGGDYLRAVGDFNLHTGEDAAMRINAMVTDGTQLGARINKRGVAPSYRWGIGTRNEFQVGVFALRNDNGMHYGLPWLTPAASGGDWLWPTDPDNYYGMASDVARSGTTQAFASHVHRFGGGRELKTQMRVAEYTRDQRASAIRFVAAAQQPGGLAVTSDNFSDATLLQRSGGTGVQLKTMNMDTAYVQSDYSGRHKWLGLDHSLQAGVDVAHEKFENFGLASASPVLTKPRATVGSPDDGAWIDESRRVLSRNRTFAAKGLGAYVQDLAQIAPMWKLLAGLRWDKLDGSYHNLSTAAVPPTNLCGVQPLATIERSDSLWSRRFGVLFQPNEFQSYHLSYGTSFNTSGDTYQYDAGTVNTPPEKSRNVELGAKIDSAGGNFTTRVALFHSTKYNERNRDAESVNACNYVLSGKRHAAGFELDLTGRITKDWEVYGSYAYIPSARVDASSGAAGTEAVGSRPGLTPRHSGTIWTTYQIDPRWRVGGGLNARSSDRPVGLAATSAIVAPKFVTADLMAEYTLQQLSYKLSLTNVTDEHYADFLYRGHYIPGKGRAVQATMTYKF